jgi:hypothetical protein
MGIPGSHQKMLTKYNQVSEVLPEENPTPMEEGGHPQLDLSLSLIKMELEYTNRALQWAVTLGLVNIIAGATTLHSVPQRHPE